MSMRWISIFAFSLGAPLHLYAQDLVLTITVPAAAVTNIQQVLDEKIDPPGEGGSYRARSEAWIRSLVNEAIREFKIDQRFAQRREQSRAEDEQVRDLDVFR